MLYAQFFPPSSFVKPYTYQLDAIIRGFVIQLPAYLDHGAANLNEHMFQPQPYTLNAKLGLRHVEGGYSVATLYSLTKRTDQLCT